MCYQFNQEQFLIDFISPPSTTLPSVPLDLACLSLDQAQVGALSPQFTTLSCLFM